MRANNFMINEIVEYLLSWIVLKLVKKFRQRKEFHSKIPFSKRLGPIQTI